MNKQLTKKLKKAPSLQQTQSYDKNFSFELKKADFSMQNYDCL